jgi:Zn-dependent peptidase ImmA (M78 family)
MDSDISAKISKEWGASQELLQRYVSYYAETIRPIIKINYLSHLVTTVENMVNDKRMRNYFAKFTEIGQEELKGLLASRTVRLYSIVLKPVNIKRRATTRYHHSGAIIYYNSCFEEKIIRILIAHEVGHIVNKELLENAEDSEKTANLFAYVAMCDKNKFYTEDCHKFVSKSDIEIFNDILNICFI